MTYYRYPVQKIGITSDFGERMTSFHYGIDLGWFDYFGEEVFSVGDGVVIDKGYTSSAGNYVTIKHNESDTSSYLHLRDVSPLNIGDKVYTGTLIGYMGTTGHSDGVHLHFSFMRDGVYIDPKTVLYVYDNQAVGETTKNNYTLLYYSVPTTVDKPVFDEDETIANDDIESLKNQIIEKDKLIEELSKYKFKYLASETAKYQISLNKGETLYIK